MGSVGKERRKPPRKRQEADPDFLTARQELFIRKVVELENVTEAYLQSGYKCTRATASVNGHRMLRKTKILKALELARQARLEKVELNIQRALLNLNAIVQFDLRTLFDEDSQILPIAQWPDDAVAAVKSIEEKALGTRLTFFDKLHASLRIAEAGGHLTRHVEVEGDLAKLLADGATDEDRMMAGCARE